MWLRDPASCFEFLSVNFHENYSSHTRFPPGASAGASRHHYHSQFSRTDRRTSVVGNATAKMRFSWDNKTGGGKGGTGELEDWTYKKVSPCSPFNLKDPPLNLPNFIKRGLRIKSEIFTALWERRASNLPPLGIYPQISESDFILQLVVFKG